MATSEQSTLFRKLPSVDDVLRLSSLAGVIAAEGTSAVTEAARAVLAELREQIAAGRLSERQVELALAGVTEAVRRQIRKAFVYSLKPVINATGVVLHTNLGRAPLAESALMHLMNTAREYSNLEFDLHTGARGKRDMHAQGLFSRLLETEARPDVQTIVVNNCAAAVLLALNSLAEGGEVIVSRGELVEIGGSFRVPEVMAKASATLREVGTTNRTRIADYESAITEKTRLLLRVHRSNFAIVGFTEQPSLEELVTLGKKRNIPVLEDLGNGALVDLRTMGLNESGVADSLRAGVDLITYSGDKLLGGPQAGMLSGRADLIAKCRSNPLFRALRIDKLTYAALEGTLLEYLRGNHDSIPALRVMRTTAVEIRVRAEAVSKAIGNPPTLLAGVIAGESVIGGGTAPSATLPTFLVAITREGLSADELLARLRRAPVPIISRIEDGRVLLDLRTVVPEQDATIVETFRGISR
jgi:L-seryl-tRNA(Ser) seleniumtransferase